MRYKLMQVKRDKTREFGFMGLDMMKRLGIEVKAENYLQTYEGEVEGDGMSAALEELFYIFNEQRPADFTHYSMSCGDIVVLESGTYFCDSFGFKQIENIFAEIVCFGAPNK